MSPDSYQLFNTWFPAIVVALIISLLAAALWDILRRKTWCFAARFWPGILHEVGLENSCLSRVEVEEKLREVNEMLCAHVLQITNALVSTKSSMAGSVHSSAAESSDSDSAVSLNYDSDIEAQPVINPPSNLTGKSTTFPTTVYFPDDTPSDVIRPAKKFLKRYSNGTIKRWKSSIVLQASLPIEPCVLAEIGVLAKSCMHDENRCIFQLGNWAILYYNAGEVQLHILKEGDVPVNVEARWDDENITMRGLYLNGAQVKVASERTNTTLRSDGPATQRPGELDELHFPSGELDVPGEDLVIFAAKIVEADGISLTVRSEASFIHPRRGNLGLTEVIWGQLRRIPQFAKKMTQLFLKDEDRQPKTTYSWPELRFDQKHQELIVEHWKGVSEIELLENRKEVLHYLQELRVSEIVDGASSQPPVSHLDFIRDGHSVEYWQRGLQDLNEVILHNTGGPHPGRHISIRGGIKFLLGDFESALQDFDLAYLNMGGHQRTILFERAIVKCLLARYAEALQDVVEVLSINPNLNDIQELQRCIYQILGQQQLLGSVESGPLSQRPKLSDQDNPMVKIPDLLTGDEWHSGEIESPCTISDDITGGGLIVDRSSMHANWTNGQPVECGEKMKRNFTSGLEASQIRIGEKSQEVLKLGGTDALGNCVNYVFRKVQPDVKTFTDHLKEALCVANAESTDLAQPTDVTMLFKVDTSPIKFQLKNYAETLDSKPRYHVRRISFIANILDGECGTDDVVKLLSAEDQELLNWQAWAWVDELDDVEVRSELTYLSERLCPYQHILLSLFDKVSDDDTHQQWTGQYPLSSYRQVSFRSALLTKHSAPDREVQLQFLYDGLPEDLSSLRWCPHHYIKLGFSEARPSYKVFWLVQWDVVDLLEPISDGLDATVRMHYREPVLQPRRKFAGRDETSETVWDENSESVWDENSETVWDENSEAVWDENSEAVWDENSESVWDEKSETVRGQNSETVVDENRETTSNAPQEWDTVERPNLPGNSRHHGVRFRPDLRKWVAEIRVAEWQTSGCENYISRGPQSKLGGGGGVAVPARTRSPFSDGSGQDVHCCRGARTKPRTTQTGYGRKPGTSQYYGVRFRPDLNRWVAEIRVAEWIAVDKKVWLGTFDTEQAAARSVDLARKLLKCKKKQPFNLPCEKLVAYSRQIPPHLILTDLTTPSMFKHVTLFLKHECREYAASFKDTPTGQSGLERQTAIPHSSSAGELSNSNFPLVSATKQLQGIQIDDLVQVGNGQELIHDNTINTHSLHPDYITLMASSGTQERQVACDPSQAEAGLHQDWRQVSSTPTLAK